MSGVADDRSDTCQGTLKQKQGKNHGWHKRNDVWQRVTYPEPNSGPSWFNSNPSEPAAPSLTGLHVMCLPYLAITNLAQTSPTKSTSRHSNASSPFPLHPTSNLRARQIRDTRVYPSQPSGAPPTLRCLISPGWSHLVTLDARHVGRYVGHAWFLWW